MPIRILLVDDVPAIRRALRFRIEAETDWEICGEAENGKVAIERVQECAPDVVLLDLSMPVMNGLEAAGRIKAIAPGIHIVMLTLHIYPQLLDEARRVGVENVLSKSRGAGSDVLQAVRSLVAP